MNKNRLLTIGDVAYVSVFSLIALILFNIDTLLRYLAGEGQESYVFFNERITTVTDSFVGYISDFLFTPNIATFVLWGVLGFISYVAVELFFDTTKDLKDTVNVAVSYVHPKNFKQSSYWIRFFLHGVAAIFIVFVLLYWIFLILTKFIPFASSSLIIALHSDIGGVQRLGYIAQAYIGVFTGILGFLVIVRIIKLTKNSN